LLFAWSFFSAPKPGSLKRDRASRDYIPALPAAGITTNRDFNNADRTGIERVTTTALTP
jgi:hypothetical protein